MRSVALWCWGSLTIIAILLGLCALVGQSPDVTSVSLVGLMLLCAVFFCRIVALETKRNAIQALDDVSDILRNKGWDR